MSTDSILLNVRHNEPSTASDRDDDGPAVSSTTAEFLRQLRGSGSHDGSTSTPSVSPSLTPMKHPQQSSMENLAAAAEPAAIPHGATLATRLRSLLAAVAAPKDAIIAIDRGSVMNTVIANTVQSITDQLPPGVSIDLRRLLAAMRASKRLSEAEMEAALDDQSIVDTLHKHHGCRMFAYTAEDLRRYPQLHAYGFIKQDTLRLALFPKDMTVNADVHLANAYRKLMLALYRDPVVVAKKAAMVSANNEQEHAMQMQVTAKLTFDDLQRQATPIGRQVRAFTAVLGEQHMRETVSTIVLAKAQVLMHNEHVALMLVRLITHSILDDAVEFSTEPNSSACMAQVMECSRNEAAPHFETVLKGYDNKFHVFLEKEIGGVTFHYDQKKLNEEKLLADLTRSTERRVAYHPSVRSAFAADLAVAKKVHIAMAILKENSAIMDFAILTLMARGLRKQCPLSDELVNAVLENHGVGVLRVVTRNKLGDFIYEGVHSGGRQTIKNPTTLFDACRDRRSGPPKNSTTNIIPTVLANILGGMPKWFSNGTPLPPIVGRPPHVLPNWMPGVPYDLKLAESAGLFAGTGVGHATAQVFRQQLLHQPVQMPMMPPPVNGIFPSPSNRPMPPPLPQKVVAPVPTSSAAPNPAAAPFVPKGSTSATPAPAASTAPNPSAAPFVPKSAEKPAAAATPTTPAPTSSSPPNVAAAPFVPKSVEQPAGKPAAAATPTTPAPTSSTPNVAAAPFVPKSVEQPAAGMSATAAPWTPTSMSADKNPSPPATTQPAAQPEITFAEPPTDECMADAIFQLYKERREGTTALTTVNE